MRNVMLVIGTQGLCFVNSTERNERGMKKLLSILMAAALLLAVVMIPKESKKEIQKEVND